jgi:hypothetical protein
MIGGDGARCACWRVRPGVSMSPDCMSVKGDVAADMDAPAAGEVSNESTKIG